MKPTVVRNLSVAALLIAQLAAIILLLLIINTDVNGRVQGKAKQSIDLLADNAINQTRLYLSRAADGLHSGRLLISDNVIEPGNDRAIERFFLAQLRANESIQGLFIGRRDGSLVHTWRHREGVRTRIISYTGTARSVRLTQYDPDMQVLLRWPSPHDNIDPRNQRWYQTGLSTDAIQWTMTHDAEQSEPNRILALATIGIPGGHGTVIGMHVEPAQLNSLLTQLSGGGRLIITNDRKQVIAASQNGSLATPVPAKEEGEKADLQSGFSTVTHDGARYYRAIRTIQSDDPTISGWRLHLQMPVTEYSGGMTWQLEQRLQWLLALIAAPAIAGLAIFCRLSTSGHWHQRSASRDSLTGALTRQGFERQLASWMRAPASNRGTVMAVAAVDIDNFNRINAQFGHHAGDAILRAVVHRLRKKLHRDDLICRPSGDHFLIATRVNHAADVLPVMTRLHQALVSEPVISNVARHDVGATIGVATHGEQETAHELILRAGQALITGKLSGKNRCYAAARFDDLDGHMENSGPTVAADSKDSASSDQRPPQGSAVNKELHH